MADEYGVLRGHVETVHSFTNDQNLWTTIHKSDRRGRSAPLNMVITETGAASAVAKALPDLKAKITGSSIRVPVPDVSIAILNLQLARETDPRGGPRPPARRVPDLAAASARSTSSTPPTPSPATSSARAAPRSSTAGPPSRRATTPILYLWYDNEFGYSCQVVRVIEKMAGDARAGPAPGLTRARVGPEAAARDPRRT